MAHLFTNLIKACLIANWCLAQLASAEFKSISLTGKLAGSALGYEVTLKDPNANGRDTITIQFTVPSNSWAAVGISPNGTMIGGEVVIAKPAEQTVRKYKIGAKDESAILEMPAQTLVYANYLQAGGITAMTFTKILDEDGEFAINPNGVNKFIASYGRSNTFGFHQGYGVQEIILATKPDDDDPTGNDGDVTPVPTSSPTTTPPSPIPTTTDNNTTIGDDSNTTMTPTPDPEYGFRQVPLGGLLSQLSFRYRLNRNDINADGRDTVSIRFTCPGNVWVGVGVSRLGSMVPSKSVRGFPESGEAPMRYSMKAQELDGVNPLPEDEQDLIDPQIIFENDKTTLSYTIPIFAEGMNTTDEFLEVHADGRDQNFIFACGTEAVESFHRWYGSLSTVVEESDAVVPTPVPVTSEPTVMAPTPVPVTQAPNAASSAPSSIIDFEEVPLSGKLKDATFRYRVNRDDANADGADTITIEFTCPGNVWVGVGVSQFGGMVPSKSVRGFPGSGNPPLQYSMTSQTFEGVNPLPGNEQVLIDPQITFANNRTTLLFTKPLDSPADVVFRILADGTSRTNFIGACGSAPEQSFHQSYGGFSVAVKDTAPALEGGFRQVPLSGSLAAATFQYRLNRNDFTADGADTITIEFSCPRNVWVGVGKSELGTMTPSKSVIGFSGSTPLRYSMQAKLLSSVTPLPDDEQNLIDPQFIFADGRSTLRYTIPIAPIGDTDFVENDAFEIYADGRINRFIGACGSGPSTSYFHYLFGSFVVVPEEGTAAPTTAAPFSAPTNPPGAEVLNLSGDLEGSTFSYRFNPDDPKTGGKDSITVTYTSPGTRWIGVGRSESGLMVGSQAVIGVPSTGEVKKYTLYAKSEAGVIAMPEDKQTLVDASITQVNGMTTLTYTKILVEDGEIPINRFGDNIFVAAQGSSNTLGVHAARGSFSMSGKAVERDKSLWKIHAWLAAIAWGALCPLAILAGLFRGCIPGEGIWFTIHRSLQSLVILFTIGAVVVAILALEKETPANLSANHFSVDFAGGHRLIGLVVLVAAVVQGANGIMRPHLAKPEETDDGEGNKGRASSPQLVVKSGARKVWEPFHRLLGVGLLALSWYQIYLGIIWYNKIFNSGESESTKKVYYLVIAVFGGLIFLGALVRGFARTGQPNNVSGHSLV